MTVIVTKHPDLAAICTNIYEPANPGHTILPGPTNQDRAEHEQSERIASPAKGGLGFGAGFCVSFGATPVFIFVWAFIASGLKYWDGLAGDASYAFLLGAFGVALCLVLSRRWRWLGLGLVAGLVIATFGIALYVGLTNMGRAL